MFKDWSDQVIFLLKNLWYFSTIHRKKFLQEPRSSPCTSSPITWPPWPTWVLQAHHAFSYLFAHILYIPELLFPTFPLVSKAHQSSKFIVISQPKMHLNHFRSIRLEIAEVSYQMDERYGNLVAHVTWSPRTAQDLGMVDSAAQQCHQGPGFCLSPTIFSTCIILKLVSLVTTGKLLGTTGHHTRKVGWRRAPNHLCLQHNCAQSTNSQD